MAGSERNLISRRADAWLVGGVGVVTWVLCGPIGLDLDALAIGGVVGGMLLVCSATHFGASYHLAYAQGMSGLRKRPVQLVAAPLAIAAFAALIIVLHGSGNVDTSSTLLRYGLVSVFTLTGWHYIKQAYGVSLLVARGHGIKPNRTEAKILRYSLYPVWFYNVTEIWAVDSFATYRGYQVSNELLPRWAVPVVIATAVVSLAVAGWTMWKMSRRAGHLPPLGLWGSYAGGGLWFLLPPTPESAAVILTGVHALQYLPCVHRAEVDWAVERGEKRIPSLWLSLIGGAAAGGLLAAVWLPDILDGSLTTTGVPGMYGSLLFIGLNLHHYAIDAAIWRSGGEHVRRITKGPVVAEEPATQPVSAPPEPALA